MKPTTRRHKILRLINILVVSVLGAGVAGMIAAVSAYMILSHDLPKLTTMADYHPNIISYVYDKDGMVIGEFKFENQRRILVRFDDIPEIVVQAIVSAEDASFWKHEGLDYMGMVRAFVVNLRTGKFSQGGSTITQQVTRSLLLTKEKKLARKIKEMILAQKIEGKLSKQDILALYLNEIYFGNGAYGIAAAVENYFGKSLNQVTLAEASLLAGLPQAPSRYSPYRNLNAAKARQKYVLKQMVDEKYVTQAQADAAYNETFKLKHVEDLNAKYAPYFVEHVRRYVMKTFGPEKVLKEGLRIYTTLDTKLQKSADEAVDFGLRQLDKRQGWRGVEKHIPPEKVQGYLKRLARRNSASPQKGQIIKGVVTSLSAKEAKINLGNVTGTLPVAGAKWIEKVITPEGKVLFKHVKNLEDVLAQHDLIEVKIEKGGKAPQLSLEQPPKTQAALLAMDPHTRYVLAMVGGSDFNKSTFNRAIQAKRQPGSSFKPVVYAAALDAGMTPATTIDDTALVFKDGWRPGNYDGQFKGTMTLRRALTKSVNTVTIRIVDRIGADYVYRYAHRLGIKSLTGGDLSMALGTYEIPPVELINAYAVFASGGKLGDPIFIKRIESFDGKVVVANIMCVKIMQSDPMKNVPDVSNWANKGKDLEQGAYEDTAVADPIAKQQFYEDFNLNKKDKGEIKEDTLAEVKNSEAEAEGNKVVFEQVISPQTAYLISSILHSVATSGTGARSNVLGKIVAGKTGTTNDYVDAWFIGFSPDVLAGVWVGNDAGSKPIGRGETGSSAALPIWIEFMKTALADKENNDFPVPKGISVARVDPKTGLLAWPETKGAYNEYFKSGTEPIQYTEKEEAIEDATDFFELGL